MKSLKVLALFMLSLAAITACDPLSHITKRVEAMQVVAKPDALEAKGDSIMYTLKGKIPAKMFHKKAYATMTAVVRYDGKTKRLNSINLRGESTEGKGRVINYKTGGAFSIDGEFGFEEAMAGKDLVMDLEIKVCKSASGDDCTTLMKEGLTKGVITTSRTHKNLAAPFIYSDAKPQPRKLKSTIFFQINRWTIQSSEKRGDEVKKLQEFVQIPRLKIKGISINSYASPDGELRINQNLTQKRAESTYSFLERDFKKLGVNAMYDEKFFKRSSMEEDWAGLKNAIKASSYADKADALKVIDSKMSSEDKEAALRKLPSWDDIVENVMPRLRRSDVIINAEIEVRGYDKLKEAAKESFETFTNKELYLYAEKSASLDDKEAAFKYFIQKNPNRWIGYNNLAGVYILRGDYNAAKGQMEKAMKLGSNDSMLCNYGIIQLEEGSMSDALKSFTKAQQSGIEEAGANKGIPQIALASYGDAVASFPSNQCDYNAALANLMTGNIDVALNKIDCALERDADMYYLKAVANARKKDVDAAATSIRMAAQKDASVKERATNDLEFRYLWDKDEFINALK